MPAKFDLVFVLTQENAFSQRLDLKPKERVYVRVNVTRNIQNSPTFQRSARSYMKINGNFERF